MRINSAHIKKLREKLEWSKSKLAEMAGVNINTITRLELGLSTPQKKKLQRILRALRTGGNDVAAVATRVFKDTGTRAVQAVEKTVSETVIKHSQRVKTIHPVAKPVKTKDQPSLTSLDVQLINCIINMSDHDKIELLIKLGD
ncbi:helix-turn-helix transcriptional regulator [bacterium]|nr:helix-turn-helix transcriptional regulator [bacterium]